MNKALFLVNRTCRSWGGRRFSTSVKPRSSTNKKAKFFISTPVYYVNAEPHIGHLYSSIIADTIARWHVLQDRNTRIKFCTGTDEHGLKIQQASAKNDMTPIEYCNRIVQSYQNLAQCFNITYTNFIRTSQDSHLKTVHKFWNVLAKNDHIYSANYEGWYCISDETFLSSSQLKEVEDESGKKILISEESGHPVEWTEEKNYLFRLSQVQDELVYWLKGNENAVKPKKFYKILLDLVTRENLPDISVSRPSSRVSWGVPVPSDKSQTVYVWLDALVNYLTAAGYLTDDSEFRKKWPPDVQVIGKDILKFHGIFWPAFLIAAKLEPPRTLLCHSHWTVAHEKMSKSKGNVIDPFERAEIFTPEGLRYFLLRGGVAHSDGNYNDSKAIRVLNAELADTLGNLLNRCTGEILNPNQEFPTIQSEVFEDIMQLDVAKKLKENVMNLPDICETNYNEYKIYKVVDAIVATLHSANLFFETMKPWELRKIPEKKDTLDAVLHLTMETLRVTGVLLLPIVPGLSSNLLNKLNIPEDSWTFQNVKTFSWESSQFKSFKLLPDKITLFRRILLEDKPKIKRSERYYRVLLSPNVSSQKIKKQKCVKFHRLEIRNQIIVR
ncbi:methionine--tRNA ligase, mitochondrial [Coccinella septempunctata]|uniref:methionine--tRNA ligase, mitochondrial n=1 Tax=Coccinella septempunctata TaxID=41139 RepID=UPI001D08A030|nr:methionine--tRNA ligase, mitochondrial [Coccinella septempunctata]